MLGPIDDLRVLDLFAGSGALGIEALSRGAATATFVDSDGASIRAISDNLERIGLEAAVFRSDALAFLAGAQRHGERWNLVFVDPPYRLAHRLADDLSRLLEPVLGSGGRIVCESSHRQPLELAMPLITERRYGETVIAIHSATSTGDPNAS